MLSHFACPNAADFSVCAGAGLGLTLTVRQKSDTVDPSLPDSSPSIHTTWSFSLVSTLLLGVSLFFSHMTLVDTVSSCFIFCLYVPPCLMYFLHRRSTRTVVSQGAWCSFPYARLFDRVGTMGLGWWLAFYFF